jgi:hypothetical protein
LSQSHALLRNADLAETYVRLKNGACSARLTNQMLHALVKQYQRLPLARVQFLNVALPTLVVRAASQQHARNQRPNLKSQQQLKSLRQQ